MPAQAGYAARHHTFAVNKTKPERGKAMTTAAEWIAELKAISVAELVARIRLLEETFGVSATPTVTTMVAPVEVEAVEEPTEFDVRLTDFGAQKIQVIKAVRAATGLGLKEAKDLVDSAPVIVSERLDAEHAKALMASLTEAGGTAELA